MCNLSRGFLFAPAPYNGGVRLVVIVIIMVRPPTKKALLWLAAIVAAGCGVAVWAVFISEKRSFFINPHSEGTPMVAREVFEQITEETSAYEAIVPSRDVSCSNPNRRFVAVMMAGDAVARPLSGISIADIVIEMPVITGSVTRFMAFYGCEDAKEIGSIRSARDDYIPLAAAFDAIYAHWGGSHFALAVLHAGVIDNIDALVNPFGAFLRKKGMPAPHNGFSSTERLYRAAENLGYRLDKRFDDYPRIVEDIRAQNDEAEEVPASDSREVPEFVIGYPGSFRAMWRYDEERRVYERWRGGVPERDALTNEQVRAENVVIMRTHSRQIEGQYNDVQVSGAGEAHVHRYGVEEAGRWEKDAKVRSSRLRFTDESGVDILFAPGKIWIEIVDQTTQVSY